MTHIELVEEFLDARSVAGQIAGCMRRRGVFRGGSGSRHVGCLLYAVYRERDSKAGNFQF